MGGGATQGRGTACAVLVLLALFAPATADAQEPERLCTETLVTMSDGVRLHAWVSRLAPDHARPVMFMMDSYARSGRAGEGPEYDNACPQFLPDDYVPGFISRELS